MYVDSDCCHKMVPNAQYIYVLNVYNSVQVGFETPHAVQQLSAIC